MTSSIGDISLAQSPVNINRNDTPSEDFHSILTTHYRNADISIENDGTNMDVVFETKENYVTYEGEKYYLEQLHFHTESEHTFNSRNADGEIHLVHKSDDGKVLVVGQLLVEEFVSANDHHQHDGHDAQIDSFFNKIIDPHGPETNAQPNPSLQNEGDSIDGGKFNPSHVLHGHSQVYEYGGSLTTGALSDATWVLAADTVVVNADDLENFRNVQKELFLPGIEPGDNVFIDEGGFNNRHIQSDLVLGTDASSERLFGRDVHANHNKDLMYGGAGNDTLSGFNGHDTLFGETGSDELHGGDGGDWLISGIGSDKLYGGDGNDTLIGGIGSDELHGGHGHDVFVLAAEEGRDTIADFSAAHGDKIGLLGSGDVRFDDLDFEGHSIIFGSETLATLTGVATSTLTAHDFEII